MIPGAISVCQVPKLPKLPNALGTLGLQVTMLPEVHSVSEATVATTVPGHRS